MFQPPHTQLSGMFLGLVFHYATFTVIISDLCCYMCSKSRHSDEEKVVNRDGMNIAVNVSYWLQI